MLPAACHDLHHFPHDKRMFIQVSKYAPTDKPSQAYVLTLLMKPLPSFTLKKLMEI
jgi:hypothetical protein